MKIFVGTIRSSTTAVAIAVMLLLNSLSTPATALPVNRMLVFSKAEKHVQIKVEIHGKIDGYTVESVKELVSDWLEEAHFVVSNTAGTNVLKLHVVVKVTDDHHFAVHEDCGEWEEDKEAAVLDAIDDVLHEMTEDFIEKFGH